MCRKGCQTAPRKSIQQVSAYGVYLTAGASIKNSIICRNIQYITPNDIYGPQSGISNSYALELTDGVNNNITSDPEFVDAENNDYHLLPGSPCIDSGTSLPWMTTGKDLDGANRIINGVGDMGCYEDAGPNAAPLECNFLVSPATGLGDTEVVLTSYTTGSNMVGTVYYWDFDNNGIFETNGLDLTVVTNTFSAGSYDIKLFASNAVGETFTKLKLAYVVISPSQMYVATTGSHTSPFDTWAKAATNLAAAVALDADTVTITVGDGTFSTENVLIDNQVTLNSLNGREFTTLSNPGNNTRILKVTDAGAVIDGFTMTGAVYSVELGAAVRLNEGTIQNCTLRNNYGGPGGTLYMLGGSLASNCLITANHGNSSQGGGVRMDSVNALMTHCIISNNTVSMRGAGAYVAAGTLRNCLIVTNRITANHVTYYGGGVALFGANSAIENCTVADNHVGIATKGAGVYLTAGASIKNSIIYRNIQYITPNDIYGPQSGISNSCALELTNGVNNNVNTDPEFVNAENNDYHLLPGSPCLDSGTNTEWMTGGKDLDGNNRIINGVGDMGCYEDAGPDAGPLESNFLISTNTGLGDTQVILTSFTTGSNMVGTVYYWDFDNDGTFETNGLDLTVVTNTFSAGSYDIRLFASNAVETFTKLKLAYVVISPSQMYVATTGSHTSPFDTWAKAATNLAAAVALDADTVTITVGDGTFSTENVLIDNQVTLKSVNGSDATTLSNPGNNTRILRVIRSGAVIDGFTLSGASYTVEHGGAIRLDEGTIRNCTLKDNVTGGSGQGGAIYMLGSSVASNCLITANAGGGNNGGGVYMGSANALMTHCIISNNTASTRGGGVFLNAGTLRNCLITTNRIINNHATYYGGGVVMGASAVLESCTVVNNSVNSLSPGGGVYGGANILTNCIVYHNTKAGAPDDIYMATTYANIGYSCAPELTDGVNGNITNAPLFVDASASDYTLQPISPCRNSGIQIAWMIGALDLAGRDRLVGLPDMGAYEWQPAGGTVITIR